MENRSELEKQEKLPNAWRDDDQRMKDCLELLRAITNISDCSQSGQPFDKQKCEELWNPLELAEALKKAASKIELLTEAEKPPEEE